MPKMGAGHLPLLYIPDGASRYAKLPALTTAQRDALTAIAGMVLYNSTTGQVEEYNGSTWRSVGQAILTTHEADLAGHTVSPQAKLRTGQFLRPFPVYSLSNMTIVADTIYAIPFVVARALTIDRLGVDIMTAAAAGKVARLGIYLDGTNLYPGALLLDAGTVTVDATGSRTITVSQALTKGLYWLGFVSDGAPGATKGYAPPSILGQYGGLFSTTLENTSWTKASVGAGALADPFVAGAALDQDRGVQMGVRTFSLD